VNRHPHVTHTSRNDLYKLSLQYQLLAHSRLKLITLITLAWSSHLLVLQQHHRLQQNKTVTLQCTAIAHWPHTSCLKHYQTSTQQTENINILGLNLWQTKF